METCEIQRVTKNSTVDSEILLNIQKKMQFFKFTSTIDPVSKFNLLKWSDLAAAKEKGACEDIVFDCILPAPRTSFVKSFSVIVMKFLIKWFKFLSKNVFLTIIFLVIFWRHTIVSIY